MNSRGAPTVGAGLVGANQSQHGNGNMNFGAMSNSSHYHNRNMSPQPGGLQAGIISKVAPSSGGSMGQGLGMIGRLGPGSEANTSSFYSNNTSANLSNSRYLLKGRDNKMVGPPSNVGKVMPPIMKSIDNAVVYGSHTSNFPIRNSSYPLQTDPMNQINKINQINKVNNGVPAGSLSSGINQSSFYSSQAHSIHNGGPVGSANYEKIQAKYALGKDFGANMRALNQSGPNGSPYDAQAATQMMMGSGLIQHQ